MASKRQTLIKKVDRVFSLYIRLRDSDDNGFVHCFTCGVRRHFREVDCGHFMSRACLSTRWNEHGNCEAQCKYCNGFRSGEQYQFAKNLDAKYGKGTADGLVRLSKQTTKYSTADLQEMYDKYKRLSDELMREKAI